MCILCSLAGKGSGGLGCLDAAAAPTGDGTGSGNAPGSTTDVVETSDAAAGATTAYSLGSGQSVQGRIASLGDSDWYKVTLVAGHTYTFAVAGEGATSNNLQDPYLRLRDSAGAQIAFNDDGGPGGYSSLTYTAATSGTYYVDVQAYNNASTGRYGMSVIEGTKASYDIEMGAGALLVPNVSWSASPGTVATVTWGFRQSAASYSTPGSNTQATFSQLSAAEVAAVQTILQFWSDIAGVQFQQVNPGSTTNNATILFANYNDPNDGAGAFAYYPGSSAANSPAGDVFLNLSSISTSLLPFGSYSFFAIMHEVGHTLGLAHPGDYNAAPGQTITYANNAQFTQDSQQYSVMSYFDEANTGAQYLGYADTPMLLDVYALQQLYGANMSTRTGNTVYGFNTNAGAVFNFATNSHPAFTIWDAGGTDTLDASGYSQNATINLNAGTYSSVGGLNSNIAIAVGAVIENATGGSGSDTIIGNDADNTIRGNGGNDTIDGGAGTDTIVYGAVKANYTATLLADDLIRIVDNRAGAPDGTDTVNNSELWRFSDGTFTTQQLLQLVTPDVRTTYDFDGDGKSDIIFQHTNGAVVEWLMSDNSIVSQTQLGGSGDPNWHIISGGGDFNGDGKSDIVWQHTSGIVTIWLMNGTSFTQSSLLSGVGSPNGQVIATGDFNGDGNSDLILQNINGAVFEWLMNGTSIASQTQLGGVGDPDWHVISSGDFNGDGRSDLIWQNGNGAVVEWLMNGTSIASQTQLGGAGDPNWHVVATGDFNGDDKSDIIFQHTNGAVVDWLMNGSSIASQTQLGGSGDPNWHVKGTSDYNGDGKADILWQNTSGAVVEWLMDGSNFTASGFIGGNGDPNWHALVIV